MRAKEIVGTNYKKAVDARISALKSAKKAENDAAKGRIKALREKADLMHTVFGNGIDHEIVDNRMEVRLFDSFASKMAEHNMTIPDGAYKDERDIKERSKDLDTAKILLDQVEKHCYGDLGALSEKISGNAPDLPV